MQPSDIKQRIYQTLIWILFVFLTTYGFIVSFSGQYRAFFNGVIPLAFLTAYYFDKDDIKRSLLLLLPLVGFFLYLITNSYFHGQTIDINNIKSMTYIVLFSACGSTFLAKNAGYKIWAIACAMSLSIIIFLAINLLSLDRIILTPRLNYTGIMAYRHWLNPNQVGEVFAAAGVLLLTCTIQHKKARGLMIIAFLACFYCIIWSGTRGSLIAILTTAFIVILCESRFYPQIRTTNRTQLITAITVTSIAITLIYLNKDILFRGDNNLTMTGRTFVWSTYLEEIKKSPYWGHGFLADYPYIQSFNRSIHAHNYYLMTLFQLGIVGLVIQIINLSYYISKANLKQNKSSRCGLYMLTCVAINMLSSVEGIISRPNYIWFLIWLPFVLLLSSTKKENT